MRPSGPLAAPVMDVAELLQPAVALPAIGDDLRARLEAFARPSASLAVPKDADTRKVTWTEPKLMAEVRYATRTAEGRLRLLRVAMMSSRL